MKDTKGKITYTERGGIFYPDLKAPTQTDYPIGKYGQMRLDFIKKHRRGTYTTLLTTFKLNEHLHEVDTEARRMVDQITAQLAAERGIDEDLKSTDQLGWVQERNNCKACAEEIVQHELICQ